MAQGERFKLFISSPFEPEYVERIRQVAPERVEVVYEPDLLPATRYVADHDGVPEFTRTPEQEARYRKHLREADFLLDFPKRLPSDGTTMRDLIPSARWVQTTSAGVGQQVARLGLQNSDILVTTSSGIHAGPLAEFVFLTLLAHVKELERLERDKTGRRWERFCSDELAGKTLAIVGPGKIGRQVARVGRAFDMRVVAMGRGGGQERATELGVDQVFPREHLHQMLGQADAVVISVPHTPETEGMIDAAAFAAMKPGVVFVNIGRGVAVDESALIEGLRSGRIAFAGLDVFAQEPLPADSPLWELPNVLFNPHSASTAFSENARITEILCHNLRCMLEGREGEMRNLLDKQRMY
ncbi:MAG TPA: D-2-hydroxyacid dehydrogenase [Thermomicrobiaceae bacterium]|nr:D-2-hydroxyacid dehydrogenase [Thermomicrobiaceae bacterium]